MASTYTANTGIEKPGSGEQAGTWGTTANNDFDIIDRALNGVGSISLSGTTHTLTTTDGTLSDGMYKVLVFGGSPSGTNTVTVSPNDQQKIFYAKNDSGESVIISQGSGASITINNGETRIVYCDGAGAGAAVVDLTATLAAGVPSGTSQLFVQTSAPTGWTKDTTNNNDSALRIVTGSASTGGSAAFSSAFGTPAVSGTIGGDPAVGNLAVSVSGSISSTTLSINQIPSHSHTLNNVRINDVIPSPYQYASTEQRGQASVTAAAGGGGSHNHGHNLSGNLTGTPGVGNLSLDSSTASINVKYVDVIVATKD
jgi:microcystin-dependent protein